MTDVTHANDTTISDILEKNPELEGIGTYEYGWADPDAAGATGVIAADPTTDPFNPNVVRSSQGALFSMPVAVCTSQEAAEWMKAKGVRSLATSPAAAPPMPVGLEAGTGRIVQLDTAAANVFVADPKVAEVRPASATALTGVS